MTKRQAIALWAASTAWLHACREYSYFDPAAKGWLCWVDVVVAVRKALKGVE